MKNLKGKRAVSLLLTGILAFSLAACGKGGKDTASQGEMGEDAGDYVYVPSYITMDTPEDGHISNAELKGSRIYYRQVSYENGEYASAYYYLDAKEPEAVPVQVLDASQIPSYEVNEEENTLTGVQYVFSCENDVILISSTSPLLPEGDASEEDYKRQQEQTTYSMRRLTADGTEVFCTDITASLQMDRENAYLQYMCCDGSGNIFLSNGQSYIWVYDKAGNHLADVALNGGNAWIYGMGTVAGGRMAILQEDGAKLQLLVYNEQQKSFSESYTGLPANCWNSAIAATDKGLLLKSDTALYEYDLETKSYEEILKWMDCDITPDYIGGISFLEDGSYLVYMEDWSNGESSLVVLEKTAASEVVQRETLTIACMGASQYLQAAAVSFNKTNEKYKIEIVDYSESVDWSAADAETAYKDAITRFNSDITAGSGADMFYTGDIDMEVLAVKGAIEDLTPYLENSTVVNREDLFAPVLDAYTVDGILCSIPASFTVYTLAGRASELGEESGWTLEEMIAYAKENPEADILPDANKLTIFYYCILYDFNSWVNWEKGECYFNTPEFKQLLEFANGYEDAEMEINDGSSLPQQFRNHEVLLYPMDLSEPRSWQMAEAIFGEEVTAVGFPSSASNGVKVVGNETISISSASDNKEAAWSFVESLLTEESQADDMFRWGFPIRISAYESIMAEDMEPDYQYDENGEVVLDENGDPVEVSHYSVGFSNFTMDLYSVSEEEAAKTLEVINRIDGVASYNEQLMAILEEETAPYFEGQKSADEVADIIQSRVQIYVSESR